MHRFLERGAAGQLFEAASVFGAGFIAGLVDLRAQGVEIESTFFGGGANVLAFGFLQPGFGLIVHLSMHFLSPLRGWF
jgi:hypothetical protein